MDSVPEIVSTFIEVTLAKPDDFLKVRETLTRMGISSKKEKKLYQSCHILGKRGKFYVVHFKELLMLDGLKTDFSENDLARRNTIANLLHQWELVDLVDPDKSKEPTVPVSQIKIIPFREKGDWQLEVKYRIGKQH